MFSAKEQNAINEKLALLGEFKRGEISSAGLALSIARRRMSWIHRNLNELMQRYSYLPIEERAHRIIFLEHMKIVPEHSEVVRVSPHKIRINSYNFCPYLEACNQLGLDTRYICQKIGEHSIQLMCRIISPNLYFSRNYDNIRPQSHEFCEEYIELKTQ